MMLPAVASMKLSVSLTPDDVDFLDTYAREHGMSSRSATLQHAVQRLGRQVGALPRSLLVELDSALRLHLGLA